MTVLGVERTGPDDAPNVAWILHGILGSARNWTTFARRMADEAGWRIVRVDLRGHGASRDLPGPHHLTACADDLRALAHTIGAPRLVVGHSFGGKVALVARQHLAARTVVVDSLPGVAAGSDELTRVLAAIATAPMPAPRRDDVLTHLRDAGLSPPLVAWLSTGLAHGPAGIEWRFDLAIVRDLLRSFRETDAWPWVAAGDVHLVRGARSDRWTEAELVRLAAAEADGVAVTVLPRAGHWVHTDDPDGLLGVVRAEMLVSRG
jgi:esterase